MAMDLLEYIGIPSSRILLFTSGPCTISEGNIADLKIEKFIRKHLDLEENKEAEEKYHKASKFYQGLSKRLLHLKTTLDIFAYSLDQFGLYEMKELVMKSGGLIILDEEFK